MDKNGIWSEDFKIRAFMVDRHKEANLFTIQNLFQEAASNHAHFHQLGYTDMQVRGMAWVLNRLKIKVFESPKWMETVTVKTWVSQMQPFSHRHFQITRPSDFVISNSLERQPSELVLANAYSIWIPIDISTKRPKRLSDDVLPLHQLAYNCEMPEKLGHTEGGIFSAERVVQASDLDMLGHVNNVKYVEWLLDDFYRENKIDKPHFIEINYLSEVLEDSVVQLFVQKNKDKIVYTLKNKADSKEVCRAKLILQG